MRNDLETSPVNKFEDYLFDKFPGLIAVTNEEYVDRTTLEVDILHMFAYILIQREESDVYREALSVLCQSPTMSGNPVPKDVAKKALHAGIQVRSKGKKGDQGI
jgi:hypothetical protein